MTEDKPTKKCSHKECEEIGEYKAPLSPHLLHQYQWFCLKHIKEFNKGWDFYKGWRQEEIEIDIKNKTTWHRPSWKISKDPNKFSGESLARQKLEQFYSTSFFEETFGTKKGVSSDTLPHNLLTKDELTAFEFFKLAPTRNFEDIQKSYKLLAKKYHPDRNQGSKKAEEKFKLVYQHYDILKKLLIKL